MTEETIKIRTESDSSGIRSLGSDIQVLGNQIATTTDRLNKLSEASKVTDRAFTARGKLEPSTPVPDLSTIYNRNTGAVVGYRQSLDKLYADQQREMQTTGQLQAAYEGIRREYQDNQKTLRELNAEYANEKHKKGERTPLFYEREQVAEHGRELRQQAADALEILREHEKNVRQIGMVVRNQRSQKMQEGETADEHWKQDAGKMDFITTPAKVKNVESPFTSESQLQIIKKDLPALLPVLSSIDGGARAVGQDIGKWATGLIGSTSLFQKFASGVLESLAQIGAKLAGDTLISGLLSLIPGAGPFASLFESLVNNGGSGTGFKPHALGGIIPEPVYGIGAHSGRGYLMGEAGPERITPITSQNAGQNFLKLDVGGEMTLRGSDLFYSWKMARILDRKRGGNI